MSRFETRERRLTERSTAFDILLDGKFLASCTNATAATKMRDYFDRHALTTRAAYLARPWSERLAFISATNQPEPNYFG